jgi:hypothetical protein
MTLSIEWVGTVNGGVYPHIDNGVFLDGRDKTLKKHGMELHKQIESGVEVLVIKQVKDKMCTNKAAQYVKRIQGGGGSRKFREWTASKPIRQYIA